MWQHAGKVSMLMKCSSYAPVHPTYDVDFGTVDEAIRMGADAVSIGCMTLGDFRISSSKQSEDSQGVYGKRNASYRTCISKGRERTN